MTFKFTPNPERVISVPWLFGKQGAFFNACIRQDLVLMDELLKEGIDLNAPSSRGYTVLHRAAQNGHIEVVKWLLKRGANKKAKTNDGKTPADLARENGHHNILSILSD